MSLIARCLFVFLLALSLSLAAIGCGEEPGTIVGEFAEENDDANSENNDDPNQNDPTQNDNQNDPTQNDNQNDPTQNDNQNDPTQNDNQNQEPTGPVIDGEACDTDGDCQGDVCLDGDDWPYGYCTTLECESYLDCANETDENACLLNPNGTDFCVRLCDPDNPGECRDGYQCQPLQSGEGWCAPDPNYSSNGGTEPDPNSEPGPTDPTETNFEGDCVSASGGQAQIHYDIAADTDEYTIIPYTQSGQSIWPQSIQTPSTTISFSGENSFQAMGAQMFGFVNPTIIPAAPQFENQLSSGSHTYTLSTQASEVCYTLIESSGTPSTIDLNIYLVGVPGIDADNAATHPDMQAVIDHAEGIYQQAGISFGTVEYKSVSSQAEQQYSTITSEQDVSHLAAESVEPGDTADDALSANIFIVASFQMGGALGISLGIPGVPGWHGTGLSGVAMTGEDIGNTGGWTNGNVLAGNVLAHELGHFLGLFHTTEYGGQTINPLTDPPSCSDLSNPTSCPDWGNLMFASAAEANVELSGQQAFVMGVNPLTK